MKSLSEFNRIADTGERLFCYLCRLLRSYNRAEVADGHAEMFWRMLVRLSSEQLVLTAIADTAFKAHDVPDMPDDVAELLQTLKDANRNRNRRLLANLEEGNAKLRVAGIKAVAVKGAAFLAEDREGAAPWRFFGDLDLLVRSQDLHEAVSVLESIGYVANRTVYHPHHHRHYPFLRHPDGDTGIDVHTRLAGFHQTRLLDPDSFFQSAVELSIGSEDILIPSANNRMAHLIVNAQVLDYRFERRLFRLRDALDFSDLSGRSGPDLSEIKQRFEQYGSAEAIDAYLAMMGRVLGIGNTDRPAEGKAYQWAKQAESVICNPRKARFYIMKHWVRMALAHIADPRKMQFLIARLSDPLQRAEFIGKRTSYLRIFQR